MLHNDIASEMNSHLSSFIYERRDGALVGPFPPMLRFPEFGRAAWGNVKALIENAKLPKTAHEVAILATGAAFASQYELYAHERVAKGVGLTLAKIATIAAGQRPSDLDPIEGICYDVATTLAAGKVLSEPTYKHAQQVLGEKLMAELVYLVAGYCQLAVLLNAYDVPIPEQDE